MATSNTSSAPKPAESPIKNAILIVVALVALGGAGWYIYQQMAPKKYSFEIPDVQRETNEENVTADQLLDLPLADEKGQPVSLRERLGKEHLVIVFTRGSMASVAPADKGPQWKKLPNVCPYCSTQASGIASNMPEFKNQQAEVLIVFPVSQISESGDATTLKKSVANPLDPPPFPILLDVKLQAVEKLGIRAHLARPASFIIDKKGNLRFAYVAKQGSADRPSGSELLRHVTQINAEFAAPTEPANGESSANPVAND
jgi:peroxiredoxin